MYIKILIISILLIDYKLNANQLQLSTTLRYDENSYDIAAWTKQLNLQTCAIVEIGDGFCALFLENRKRKKTDEYFLGICECSVMTSWQFCSPILTKLRSKDCTFFYNDTTSRVHRRLCDITALSEWGTACNCTKTFDNTKLKSVIGFPTCFKPSVPESICMAKNPCGTYACATTTVRGGIHKLVCTPKCIAKQPFCEELGAETSTPPKLTSKWTTWEKGKQDHSFLTEIAHCVNAYTRKPSLDCLGPGTKW